MPQAKVLNEKEIRRVLLHVATKKHAARNRAMFTVLNLTGMRVGELAVRISGHGGQRFSLKADTISS